MTRAQQHGLSRKSSANPTGPFLISSAVAHQSTAASVCPSQDPTAPAGTDREAGLSKEKACRMAAPMIRQMAQRLSRSLPKGVASIDWNDLASAGFIGLLDALDKYDAHLNVPFLSFARFRVRGAMIDAMRNNDHLKRTKRTRMRLVHRAVNQLTQELDNSPTRQQVADRLGVSIRDVEEAMSPVVLLSLNAPGRNDDGTDGSPAEIADAGRSPEDLYYSRQRQLSVREAIQKRHSRERQIIQMIYDEGMDQYEAATVLGISPSRVSQLHAAALEKLQRLPAGSGLQQRTVRKTHAFFTQARKAA